MIDRRTLLKGMLFIPVAPLIVRASSLMKIVPRPRPDFFVEFYDDITNTVEKVPVLSGLDLMSPDAPDIKSTAFHYRHIKNVILTENAHEGEIIPVLWYDDNNGRGWHLMGGDTLVFKAPFVKLT